MTEQERNRRKKVAASLVANNMDSEEKARRKNVADDLIKNNSSTTSPSVTSSGSGEIYDSSAQRRQTNVNNSGNLKTIEADKKARAFVNANRGKETAYLGTGTNGSTGKINYVVTTKGGTAPTATATAKTVPVSEYLHNDIEKKKNTSIIEESLKMPVSKSRMPGTAVNQNVGVHVETDKTKSKAEQIADITKKVADDEYFKSDIDRKKAAENRTERVSTEYTEKYNNMSADSKALLSFINREEETKTNINWMGIAAGFSGQSGSNAAAAGQYAASLTTSQEARRMLRDLYGMTDDEIDAAVILHERSRNAEIAQKQDEEMRNFEHEHPAIATAVSVPMSVAGMVTSPLGTLESVQDTVNAKALGMGEIGLDDNNVYRSPSNAAKSIRDEFTKEHDLILGDYDVGDMLYNTAMSGADSLLAGTVGGKFGGVMLGAGAASDTAQELSNRGISTGKAIAGGLAAGIFEGLFESVSIGNLKAFKNADIKTVKDAAKNIAKSMAVNASEETLTEIANITYDTLANGGLSEYELKVEEYSKTMPKKDAEKKARNELALRTAEAGLSGAIMGLGFGAGGSMMSYAGKAASQATTGKTAKSLDMTNAIVAEGQAAPAGSKAQKLADKIAKKQESGKKVSSYKVGQLAESNAETKSKATAEESEKMSTAFKQKLHRELAEVDRAEATNPTVKTESGSLTVDGGNFDSKTQQLGEFKGIFKDKDGDNAVKTTDGQEIKISELTGRIENKTVARLYEQTEGMSEEAANLFIDNWDGETIGEYKRAFDYYYKMGRTGMKIDDIRANDNIFGNYLSAEAQTKIANAGLYGREFRKGLTDLSVARKDNRYKYESKVLQLIGEKNNLEIFILDEDSRVNGKYFEGTNRIVVYRNAEGRLITRTAGHESFHFIKNQATDETSKAEVKALSDLVLDALEKNGMDVEAEIKRLGAIADNEGNLVYKTREDCIEEIVANGMFDVFTNEKFAKKLLDENRGVFGKLANKIKEIVKEIKSAIAMLGNSDSVIKALKDDVDTLDKINSMFDELLTKAGEKYRAEHENGQKNNTAETVRYSIHSDRLGDYVKVDVEQNIFDNKNVREMQSIARKIINQKYKGKVLNVGVKGKAYFNKRSADEYAYPANRRMDDIIKAAKMRSSTELDNLLAISKFVNNEPDDGRHPDATGGWDIYETRFEVANIMFAGEIKIKVTDRGFIFYDITQIRRLPVNGNQTEMNSAVASGNLLNNSISKDSETVKEKFSMKSSTDNLSELKDKRTALADEYRALRMQIDEIKESAEYVAFNDEVRTVKKNGSFFGKMEKVKEIRSRQKAWADSKGLSELEERYHDISEKIHDYDLEIYKLDKAQKEKITAELTDKVKSFSETEIRNYTLKATEKFGVTNNFDNAGYMLTDGKLLDFSDGHGYRVLDHREIKEVLDFLPDNGNRSDGLIQFMNMGNIRMQIGGIDISRAPGKEQIPVLRKFFIENNGEITVDFSKENGDNAGSIEYPRGTSSTKILNDIKEFFEKGTLPQISATAAFRSMYSTKQTSPIQEHYAEVIRENRNFKQILSLLGEMQYSSVSGNVHLNSRDIDRIARDILKTTSSKYDKTKFANELTVLYDYMANSGKNTDTEEIYTSLLNIANGILQQSEMKDTELYDQYKEVREFLRTQPIYITPAVKKEIESQFGDYKSFRNALMGKVMHMTTSDSTAPTLDEVWQELSEKAPEYFAKDFNELDMPMQIAAFYEAIAPKVVNPYEHFEENLDDAAAEIATEIFQKFYEVERLKTPQEKYRNLVFENMRKLETHKKALRNEFKNKTAENEQRLFESYRERVTEYKQQREEGDRRRRLKNELERNYNYLNRRIIKETDNDHIPENLKDFVKAFRFIIPDSNGCFSKVRFTEFENEYRKLKEKTSFFDADIAERISALKDWLTPGIGAPRMRDLDNFELEELRNISEHVKYIIQNENRLFSERLKGRIEDYAKTVHSELEVKPESRAQGVPEYNAKIKDKARNSIDSFIKGLTKPEYLFSSLGSDTLKLLYDELRRGENTEAKIIADAKTAEQEIKRKFGYDSRWENQNITVDMTSGKLTVTVEQLMALYATSKRRQGLEHMLNGGVLIYSSKEFTKKNGKTKTDIKRERRVFNESDIPKLSHALTTQQTQYVDAMVEYITNDIGKKRNEISLKLNGIEKYKETYYFPIDVDRHFVDTSIGRQEVVSTIKNQSSAKRTVNHARNPIEISGFTETVNQHIFDSALYCAYVLPINDFKRVYNFRDTEFEGEGVESLIRKDVSVKEDIRRANGVNAIKQIEDFMVALDSGSRYENLMPVSAKLAARAKKVSVMANLSVVVQQPTAVFRAMLYVDPKYFATTANKADIAEMKKWNGCALKKEVGYFDVNMGRTATDYINEYSPNKSIKKDWSLKDYLQNGNAMLAIDQVAGWGASKADEMTWGAIWKACKKKVKADNGELTGDALNAAASELFQTVISKTQVYDSVFTKPDYMRRKEGFAMLATQFMSEPLTSLNMLAEAVVQARRAKGSTQQKAARKFCSRAFACYMTSVVVNSALKSLVYSMRDDDEDESFLEKYIANVTEGIVTEPFGMVPYVKDILSLLQGYDLNRTDVAVFASFKDAIDALGSEKKGAYDKIMAVLKAAGQASGIPAYAVIRDGKAILDIFDKIVDGVQNGFEPTTGRGIINELKETFDWVPGIDSENKYEQLYNAIAEGDEKHYKKVYDNLIAGGKEEGTINSEIASILAEKDSRIAATYEATAKGDTMTASSKVSELKEAGYSEDVINRALHNYKSNLLEEVKEDERIIKAAEARYNMDYDEYERIVDEMVSEGYSEIIVKDAINSEKIELETKADEFTVEEKELYTASYDLKNAFINGNKSDVRTVYNKLLKETDEEDAASEVRKYAKSAYKDGHISESQLKSYLTEYKTDDTDENDIFWDVEEIKGGDDYRKYGKLYDAIDNGTNLYGAVEYYVSHGVKLEYVKKSITTEFKPKLTSLTPGTAEYSEMYENVIDAFVATGDNESKAKKKVNKWYN